MFSKNISLLTSLLESDWPAYTYTTYTYDASEYEAYETDDKVVVEMDLPGYDKDSISVTLEKNKLVVEAKAEKKDDTDKKYYFKSSKKEEVHRSFKLPDTVSDDVSASYENGVLRIEIEKEEEKKPKKVKIK